jgi:hypothetical protein
MLDNVADILFAKAPKGAGAVSPGDVLLRATPSQQTVRPGQPATYTITVTATQDFAAEVVLDASGEPSGEGVFTPRSLTPTQAGVSSTLTVPTNDGTPPREYEIKITAVGGGKTKETTVKLIVTPT